MQTFIPLCLAIWFLSCGSDAAYKVPNSCQIVNVSMCNSILPYNLTKLPNYRRQYTQTAVRDYLGSEDVTNLVKTNCSSDLVFFLCVLHLPICVKEFLAPVLPCQKLCEKVKEDCLPTIRNYGRDWPIDIECHKFPNYEKGVCIKRVVVHKNLKNDTSKHNGSGRNRKSKGPCKCKTDEKMKWSLLKFHDRAYDFVFIGRIVRISKNLTKDNHRQITFTNIHTFRRGKFKTNRIYVPSSCPCPYLKKNNYFVIMGREDQLRKKLVLNRKSFVFKIKRMKNMRKLKKLKHLALRQFLMSLNYMNNKSSNKG
ncbi:secreted frizzled-related protein 3 [Exaiptasia diaphana]|uniref:Uncharacterized protein n=1 Tax=Exaiptasia diaphana TaxID=2652724 RepID=A0A913XTM5_EXADI|nr:secreted frizzled-related protein 3 [Exaiptasia diaphana]KXJ09170.1 Secreted frizzled-related protein 3 [Exaiptasia diaphana]